MPRINMFLPQQQWLRGKKLCNLDSSSKENNGKKSLQQQKLKDLVNIFLLVLSSQMFTDLIIKTGMGKL
jgi:hypothetical protein